LTSSYKKLGIEITESQIKKADEAMDKWAAYKTVIGQTIAIGAVRGLEGLTVANTAMDNFAARVAANVVSLRDAFAGVGSSVVALGRSIVTLGNDAAIAMDRMAARIHAAILGKLGAIWDAAQAKLTQVKKAFFNVYDAVVGHSYIPDMVAGIAQEMAQLQRVMVDPSLSATSKVGSAFASLGGIIGSIFGQKAGGILSSLGQFASALAPVFGGSRMTSVAAPGSTNPVAAASRNSGYSSSASAVTRVLVDTSPLLTARIVQGDQLAAATGSASAQTELHRRASRRIP
jgi:hypothetical protein